jgi:hypothetical protein
MESLPKDPKVNLITKTLIIFHLVRDIYREEMIIQRDKGRAGVMANTMCDPGPAPGLTARAQRTWSEPVAQFYKTRDGCIVSL